MEYKDTLQVQSSR